MHCTIQLKVLHKKIIVLGNISVLLYISQELNYNVATTCISMQNLDLQKLLKSSLYIRTPNLSFLKQQTP